MAEDGLDQPGKLIREFSKWTAMRVSQEESMRPKVICVMLLLLRIGVAGDAERA